MREQNMVHKPYAPPRGSPLEQKPTITPRKEKVKEGPPPKIKPMHLMSWDERMQVESLRVLTVHPVIILVCCWAGVMPRMLCSGARTPKEVEGEAREEGATQAPTAKRPWQRLDAHAWYPQNLYSAMIEEVLCGSADDVRMLLTDIFDGEDPCAQPWKQLKLKGSATRPTSARPFGSGSPRNFLWNVAAGSKLLPGGTIGTPQGIEALELDSHLERMQLEREERQVSSNKLSRMNLTALSSHLLASFCIATRGAVH